jgi:hypothetical protein
MKSGFVQKSSLFVFPPISQNRATIESDVIAARNSLARELQRIKSFLKMAIFSAHILLIFAL